MNDLPELNWLRELVSNRYVLEVLDALAQRQRTARELKVLCVRGRDVRRALRLLAAQGVIRSDRDGSWDTVAMSGTIRLTRAGAEVVAQLSDSTVWQALYEGAEAPTWPS